MERTEPPARLALWTPAAQGILSHAGPGETLAFAPELLPADVVLASGPRLVIDLALLGPDSEELTERWLESLELCPVMVDAFGLAASAAERA